MENLNFKSNCSWNASQKQELTMLFLNRSANDTSTFIDKAAEIAENSGYSEEQVKRIQLAAWYYDIGYAKEISASKYELTNEAINYLAQMNIDPKKLTNRTTSIGGYHVPLNDIEMILHDAEYANLVNTKNRNRNLLLRKMIFRKFGINYSSKEWIQIMFNMISERRFLTEYAGKKYQSERNNMLNDIVSLINNFSLAN